MDTKYKYFKESEVVGLQIKLVQKLDQAREVAGVPFIITSGLRSPSGSVAVGGSKGDAHTRGLAVDLRCRDSQTRFKIIGALFACGFNRIGDEVDHIHADIDKLLPQNVLWREKTGKG